MTLRGAATRRAWHKTRGCAGIDGSTGRLLMRTFFPALALTAFVAAAGCGGQSDGNESQNSQVAVSPGDACEAEGTFAPSIDGCNTCNCHDGAWTCTRGMCTVPGGVCAEGQSKPAGDGC